MVCHIDSGTFRVLWSTYQIVQSCSWNLDVSFPPVFDALMSLLSIFSFDFLSLECITESSNHFTSVLLWSITPILMGAVNALAFVGRKAMLKPQRRGVQLNDSGGPNEHDLLFRQHSYLMIMLTYLVLPPVSRTQFQSLDCITISSGRYLRIDTSIDCESEAFKSFATLDGLFIFLYLSCPVVWMTLLWNRRRRLNPPASNFVEVKAAISERNDDEELKMLGFLFSVYKPYFYWFEPVEMYRRILFVGVLPLLSESTSRRAAIGVVLAVLSAAAYREVEPFGRSSTNVLVHVAQYSIFLTFASALAIETDLAKGLDSFGFGLMLVCANLLVLGIALVLGAYRHYLDEERLWKWQRFLTDEEVEMVNHLMGTDSTQEISSETRIIRQLTLRPSDVVLKQRIGKGSFGEVFLGSCFGEDVAVKTVLDVSEASLQILRAEVLLTARLRHPCIVNFIGCCWENDLCGLVLEWGAKGSLEDLLNDESCRLSWEEPLLQLLTDAARGVQYLHSREFYDEVDGTRKRGIIHRDLKPDNVLITKYDRAKVADFGSSKAVDAGSKVVDTAGSPLFAAPEVMLAKAYDSKADVYSFGMLLLSAAASEGLENFMARRWRETRSKDQSAETSKALQGIENKPRVLLKAIKSVCMEGWRPITIKDYGLAEAPPLVCVLIVRCLKHDPEERPSFDEILKDLVSSVASQVEASSFIRERTKPAKNEGQKVSSGNIVESGDSRAEVKSQSKEVGSVSTNPRRAPTRGSLNFPSDVEMASLSAV